MKHIRCPICHTLFRVNSDLLASRGGRVRCGQCGNVFNAFDTNNATAELKAALAPMTISGPMSSSHAELGGHSQFIDTTTLTQVLNQDSTGRIEPSLATGKSFDMELEPELPPSSSSPAPLSDDHPEFDPLFPNAVTLPDDANRIRPLDEPLTATPPAPPEPEPEPEPQPVFTPEPEPAPAPEETPPPIVPDWQDDRPDLHLPPPQPEGRPGWMIPLLAVLVVLALLQSVWIFRSDLSIAIPALRGPLKQACESMGCSIPLPKESAQLGIEASELHPIAQGQNVFKLSATLRNRAPFAQEYPHLELALTDTNDNVVVRRVFQPSEYLGSKMGASFQAGSDLSIALTLDTSTVVPAGYRVYVFYP